MDGPPDWKSTAEDAVAAARQKLVGRSHGSFRVESLLWYGAVEIDTKHAVVMASAYSIRWSRDPGLVLASRRRLERRSPTGDPRPARYLLDA